VDIVNEGYLWTKAIRCPLRARRVETMSTELSDSDVARAMIANTRWGQRLGWDRFSAAIAKFIGAEEANSTQAPFASAVAAWQARNSVEVDGILGPDSWKVMERQLAPAGSLTGIMPANAPRVPSGFDEIIATFGDPQPLMEPDGTITKPNLEVWERKTLMTGELPFAISVLNDNGTQIDTVKTFTAHRLLTPVFEAVFREIERQGLQKSITSWEGIYAFRSIRGHHRLSLHAFGAALDINSLTNQLNTVGDMDPRVIEIFRHFGFLWGGDFHGRKDPMHFQYATGY